MIFCSEVFSQEPPKTETIEVKSQRIQKKDAEETSTIEISGEEAALVAPSGDIAQGTIPLKAQLSNVEDESYRIGWFVSGGKVEKRRSNEASWEEVSLGPKTIIVTSRGLSSLNFSFEIRSLNIGS